MLQQQRVTTDAPTNWGATDATNGTADLTQFISFAIGDDQYGVDVMAVRVMVPIIDLRCRFGEGLTEATSTHVVIIVQIESKLIGLLADRVLDIVSFDMSKVQAVPRVSAARHTAFLAGLATIEGAMIALIDLPNLLSVPE
jgi:purine-binding chemotaxis protein CheW